MATAPATIDRPTIRPQTWDRSFSEAKQLYSEQYGSAIVTNSYLKVALVLSLALAALLAVVQVQTMAAFRNFKPLVIRTDDVGRAEAVRYDDFGYKPREAEVKYFLTDFVRRYYGRSRYTVREDFAKAQGFLEQDLAIRVRDAWTKNKVIEEFLYGSQAENVGIEVTRVAIEELHTTPYRASVEFEEIFYDTARTEKKRLRFAAHFTFLFQTNVATELIPINPLGLAIVDFREDAAFGS